MPTVKTIPREREAYDHFSSVTLRYSDQDPMGHVNNVAVGALLESGRIGFLHHLFREAPLPARGMVLARLTVDYLHEVTFPGTVEVGGRLARVGGRSLTTHYALFQGERLCVVSESVNVFFDPETRRSTEPPPGPAAVLERLARASSA